MTSETNQKADNFQYIKRDPKSGESYFLNLTEIHNAIAQDDVNILINVLKNNKDNKIDINAKSQNGYTALMLAADKDTGHLKILLDAGADINARSLNLSTALFIAAQSLRHPLNNLQLLIDSGAQCNEFNSMCETPLNKALVAMQKKENTFKSNKVFDILLPYCDVTLEKDSLNPLLVNLLSDHLDENTTKECIYKICFKACQDGKLDILERQAKHAKLNFLISKWCEDCFYKTANSIRLDEILDNSCHLTNALSKSRKKI